jgi:hypothetical protein
MQQSLPWGVSAFTVHLYLPIRHAPILVPARQQRFERVNVVDGRGESRDKRVHRLDGDLGCERRVTAIGSISRARVHGKSRDEVIVYVQMQQRMDVINPRCALLVSAGTMLLSSRFLSSLTNSIFPFTPRRCSSY